MKDEQTFGYLAECLWPGVTRRQLADVDARTSATAAASGGSECVRYLGSILVPEDEVVFFFRRPGCHRHRRRPGSVSAPRFHGPSSGAVEAVARRAGIPFERVLGSICISDRRPQAAADEVGRGHFKSREA